MAADPPIRLPGRLPVIEYSSPVHVTEKEHAILKRLRELRHGTLTVKVHEGRPADVEVTVKERL